MDLASLIMSEGLLLISVPLTEGTMQNVQNYYNQFELLTMLKTQTLLSKVLR